jgi:L-cystine transport system permease protein
MKAFGYWKIPEFLAKIAPGITVTVEYVVLSCFFGLVFGGILAVMKLSKKKIVRGIAYGYTTVMRCTPALVLLFLVYYGAPQVIKSLTGTSVNTLERLKYVIITLTMFNASAMSEVIRSSYAALDKTQIEAAKSIGMTEVQGLIHVYLPQMMHTMLPNFCNSVLNTIKNGSLAFSIGLLDIFGMGQYIIGNNLGAWVMETYVALILIYWPTAILITKLAHWLEKNFDYEKKQGGRKKMEHA